MYHLKKEEQNVLSCMPIFLPSAQDRECRPSSSPHWQSIMPHVEHKHIWNWSQIIVLPHGSWLSHKQMGVFRNGESLPSPTPNTHTHTFDYNCVNAPISGRCFGESCQTSHKPSPYHQSIQSDRSVSLLLHLCWHFIFIIWSCASGRDTRATSTTQLVTQDKPLS